METVQMILFFFLMFFWIYQLVIWLSSFFYSKKDENDDNQNYKFMAIIPARNEEKVIQNLIKSIKKQNYPQELIDIYVIADNCTDNTANIARKAGAIVFERFNETEKSKGYALEWFFDIILARFPDKYDAFCVFDADNIVSENFFTIMNRKLCKGELIVQGYRDIKNADDNWLTGCYALFYWTMNRCYHLARYRLRIISINKWYWLYGSYVCYKRNKWLAYRDFNRRY